MKKTLLSILALSASAVFAQNATVGSIPAGAASLINGDKATNDTLFLEGGICSQQGIFYVSGFGGTSSAPTATSQQGAIDMTEIAQGFTHASGGTVSGGYAIIADKWVGPANGASSTFYLKIYEVSAGKPTTLLGTSNPVSFANLDTTAANGVTFFTFATPVAVGTAFAAALTVTDGTATTDSLSLLASFPFNGQAQGIAQIYGDCAQGSSYFKIAAGANTAWLSYKENVNSQAPTEYLDPKLMLGLFLSVNDTVSIEKNETISYSIFPNPTSDVLNVQYSLTKEGTVSMNVTDLTGRVIRNIVKENQGTFQATEQINIAGLNAGIYLLTVNANGNTTTQKFIVR